MAALTWIVIGLLVAFTARRCVLLVGAVLPPRQVSASATPTVLVVVAAHNEAWQVEPLLQALARLDYPADKLWFVLVSDGSDDDTALVFERWARGRAGTTAHALTDQIGKGAAMNEGMKLGPATELLAVYDADQRPRPDSLRRLTQAFGDARVAAAAGYRLPLNADRGIVSQYAALEAWVHQLVVLASKDRWGWNPPTMGGNCVYRVAAVAELGGFPVKTSTEDIEVSLALIARGWRTRFVVDAVADSRVGESLRHYFSQRVRWAYGMYGGGTRARSVETLAVSSGYVDRLVFLAACVLVLAHQMSVAWPAAYLLVPFLQVLAALAKAGQFRRTHIYLLGAPLMFLLDIASTAYATLLSFVGRRPPWSQPEASRSNSIPT
jgi:cellulose synthase/poly-beta-1,6-N-acetylglucosamine synthase-like glycosyltransferase